MLDSQKLQSTQQHIFLNEKYRWISDATDDYRCHFKGWIEADGKHLKGAFAAEYF